MKLKDYFDYAPYADILHLTKYELAFCIGYFIFAIILCIYSTPEGSLFFSDSIMYKRIADHFIEIFPKYSNGPIYPLFIAIGMALGLTLEQSASIVPIISYSLLAIPLFLLSKIICRPIAGYLTCIITLFCGKYLLEISVYQMTDMPYLLIAMIAVCFLAIYNKYGYMSSITLAAIFTLVAELTRPIGITLFMAGFIVIIINNIHNFKKAATLLSSYFLIAGIPFMAWKLFISTDYINFIVLGSSNPSINEIVFELWKVVKWFFYIDYKITSIIIFIICIYIIIFLAIKHQLSTFLKNAITLVSYSAVYLTILAIVTSSLFISFEGGVLDIRKFVQIYPYIILLIVSLFIYYMIKVQNHRSIFNKLSVILLIIIIIQGSIALYSHTAYLKKISIAESTDREILNAYLSENNISNMNKIYIDKDTSLLRYYMVLINNTNDKFSYEFVVNRLNGTIIMGKSSNCTARQLIWLNNCAPIYMIVPNDVAQAYTANTSNEIYISNLCEFSHGVIFKVSIPANSKFYYPNQYATRRIIDDNSPDKIIFAGNILPKCHQNQYCDQLLVMNSNPGHIEKDNTIQIIDFSNDTSVNYEYTERSGFLRPDNIMLVGDFRDMGYDQILSIIRNPIQDEAQILDFSQDKSPIIINCPDAFSNNTVFRNFTDANDIQLAGDFLSLGHSQVLFIDRNSKEKRLIIADFAKNKSSKIKEIPLTEGSARISQWLDEDDLQFAGDFMGLGHSQILFINRNHSKEEKEKIVIADFGNGNDSPSIKYQENWEKGSIFSGWIDGNDTQLVGDFMNHGDSQMLFINHAKSSGKIMIVDFNNKKPLAIANYIGHWGQNSPSLFEGWLDLNDTKVAGDFKGLGYSQVMFLNNSINGLNASIVDFSSSRPTKLYFA